MSSNHKKPNTSIPLGKPKPATQRAIDKALKEGMKQYKNALKELAKS